VGKLRVLNKLTSSNNMVATVKPLVRLLCGLDAAVISAGAYYRRHIQATSDKYCVYGHGRTTNESWSCLRCSSYYK
jgi:hypothetical protein